MDNILFSTSLLLASTLFIASCSSSSSSPTDSNNTTSIGSNNPENVALATKGATANSTFSGNESFTIDGDTTTSNFWEGGKNGDEIKITLNKTYTLSKITIYTNNNSFAMSSGVTTAGIRVFLSSDNVNYSEVALGFGNSANIGCFAFQAGSGKVSCEFDNTQSAKYIKVAVTSDFASTKIYEIEALGF